MKAIVYREYGPPREVLTLEEIAQPVPKHDEVLIRVHTASVNPLDSHLLLNPLARLMMGFGPKVKIAGRDLAGVVEAVGRSVTRFAPGDAVFGGGTGAFAEMACTKESKLAIKPEGVTFEHAAASPVAGLTALQGLRDYGKLEGGQKVLVNGASGGVGTFAVQFAAVFGAEVTAVCSGKNAELVRGLGATQVIDYTQEDFSRNGRQYDLIFDLAGDRPLSDYRRAMTTRGTYVGAGLLGGQISVGFILGGLVKSLALKPFISQKMTSLMARVDSADLAVVADHIATGKVTPVIERRYPLSETADAIQYVSEKHARGKVVISLHN